MKRTLAVTGLLLFVPSAVLSAEPAEEAREAFEKGDYEGVETKVAE